MIRRFALLACLLLSTALSAADGAWVSPVSWSDPTGKWVDVPLSWDGSTASYAADQSNAAGDGPWLALQLAGWVHTDRVLVNADFGFGIVDAVDLEARNADGTWTRLYHGAVANCANDIVTFPALTTDAIRFRFHYLRNGFYFWLYNFAVFALPASVELPQVATGAATSVTASTAALHGTIASDGGEPCAYRFRYHELGSATWTETPWGGAAVSGQGGSSVLLPVTGLQSGTTYAYHIQARNSIGVATGTDVAFTPQPVALGSVEWLAASDVVAGSVAGMTWDAAVNALDDDDDTAARCYHPLWTQQWGPDLTFALPAVEIDHVRLSAGVNPYIDAVAVELRATPEAAWTPLYQGAFADRTWLVLPLPARGTYAQARVRFHVTTTGVGTNWELYEFQVRMPPLVSFAAGADQTATQPGHLALPLRLQPATSTLPITVTLVTSGTAQEGVDWRFASLSGTPPLVTIPAGATAPGIDIEVLAGTGTQTGIFTLVDPQFARSTAPTAAIVTIQREPPPPPPVFAQRRSPLHSQPREHFDAARWGSDPDYRLAYLAACVPERVWEALAPSAWTPRLAATGSARLQGTVGGTVSVTLRAAPGMPINLCVDQPDVVTGAATPAWSVVCDTEGTVIVPLQIVAVGQARVLAGSPAASGTIHIVIEGVQP